MAMSDSDRRLGARMRHPHDPAVRKGGDDRQRGRAPGRWVAWGLTLLALLAAAGAAAFLLRPAGPPLNTKTVCAYAGKDASALAAFSRLVGRPVNCAVLFNDANPGWAQWADPWFTHPSAGDADWTRWLRAAPAVRRVVVTQEMVPDELAPARGGRCLRPLRAAARGQPRGGRHG
jgi:hypothetical protein